MAIFDNNYNKQGQLAILNWWYDDEFKNDNLNTAWDFFNMGKSYYVQSIWSIAILVDENNTCDQMDKMIFPILFGFWHGTELLLKAGLRLINTIRQKDFDYPKVSHDNLQLLNTLNARLKELRFSGNELSTLKQTLNEFKAHNADPTFMRYTIDEKDNKQFYKTVNNQKDVIYDDKICINYIEFANAFLKIVIELTDLIDYLGSPFWYENNEEINGANYKNYKKSSEYVFDTDTNILNKFDNIIKFTNFTYRYLF